MSIFELLDQIGSRAQDTINARWVRIVPKADPGVNPNVRRLVDNLRPAIDVEAIFEYNSIEFGMELGVRKSYREANDLRNVSVGRTPDVSIDRRWFPDHNAEPRQGDRLYMLKLNDQLELILDSKFPAFEVMDNQRDGMARMVLRLIQLGSQV